ncbi:MAG: hypothetical protein MI755_03605 [Sphingomonadales bacterium]|nr:hypothetical protein [Sphingomonadales bacterium]
MLDSLMKRRSDAEAEYERLDAGIAEAITDGKPDREIRKLRARRRDAAEEADDAGEALRVAEDRAAAEAATQERGRRRTARAEASKAVESYVAAARSVDSALAGLEEAAVAYRLACLDLLAALRRAGIPDDGRPARMARPHAKWSGWMSAPTWCEQAEVARTPVSKRYTLEELTRRVVPAIPEEED